MSASEDFVKRKVYYYYNPISGGTFTWMHFLGEEQLKITTQEHEVDGEGPHNGEDTEIAISWNIILELPGQGLFGVLAKKLLLNNDL